MRIFARATWAAERMIGAVATGAAKVAKAAKAIPPALRLTQLQPENEAHWPVKAILFALAEHENGEFAESAKLAAAFGRDDRIAACRGTRIRALVGKNGATFDLVPSEDGDQRRSNTVAERAKRIYFDVFTEAVVSRIQGDVIDLGVSISRIHWQHVGGEWIPRIEPWDMRWIRYDHFRGCYVAQAQEGLVDVTPGTGEWLIVEPAGARGWMAGAVRALAMPFFFRSSSWKDWARYCEKHGVPILAISEPPSSQTNADKTTKDTFFARLKQIGREGILRLPKGPDGKGGFSAEIVEPKTLSWPAFEAFLKRLDVCIAVWLLGQNLSTEVQGGSLAAAVAQNRVRLDYLAADAEALSTAFRAQVLAFWGRFNFESWDDALAPWPKWNTAEPEDQKSRSMVLVNIATSLEKLKKNNSPVDERALLEQNGVPLLSEAEVLRREQEAAKKAADAAKAAPPGNAKGVGDDKKAPAKADDAEKES